MAMIKIKNISLAFDNRAVLSDFSAEIATGTITAITGRNGAGKSTLLAAIAGDQTVAGGEIILLDRAISSLTISELATIRSVATQSHSYWMAYTTAEILTLGNEQVSSDRFNEIVRKLELEDFLDQSVTTLSGGQLQRIEIARAFMRELPIILLDEPFASQDLASITRVKELLVSEKSKGVTIVLVDHARDENLNWCDQVIDLDLRPHVQ